MEYKKNRPATQLGKPKSKKPLYGNSASSQRARLLKFFELTPRISTMEAREMLGILHPGGRIMELRKKGYRIDTNWIEVSDANGVMHRIGLYVYQGKSGGRYEIQ
ncbi:TPA: helix-turn-helix domain-containing protein [Legionella pneumophila]|uniref:Winged helix-turn-helix domain-containing protein n=1 Tax=Legionella pneumophila subsp. pneumophila TaxID=91891 RepID=A0A3A6W4V1_LEGPN|nr:helix-turn-helix domain-containing protein [Legionella pneumophila]ERH41952.1 hypothetical protein N750_15505 [Legionella pneumophila str. Leg01/53]ERH45186.1 hypothetical protein N751_00810 [Legionella pneumophila str. Leg01/11]ERI48894.1 hypothetical protein N749_07780 [Legionella pneumophila str. Leg01/20]ERB42284.1 hypothetical protein N748_04740 [Legionella pneumophila str. 121004]MCW8392385.1 helix-turn-helix domain-containing protein [Legionella pneumophila]